MRRIKTTGEKLTKIVDTGPKQRTIDPEFVMEQLGAELVKPPSPFGRSEETRRAYLTLTPADIRLLTGVVGNEPEHVVIVKPHDVTKCHTAKFAKDGDCGTKYEANCSCDFGQGASSEEHAEIIAERHIADPTEVPVFVEMGRPTVVTIPTKVPRG